MKHKSISNGEYTLGMPRSIKERKWVDITAAAEAECVIQVELSRMCSSTGRVRTYVQHVVHIPNALRKFPLRPIFTLKPQI